MLEQKVVVRVQKVVENIWRSMVLYNTNGFRTETMYDYYIVMKSMFLVVKLSSHSSIGYVSLTIPLPWITHKQH
jgi:hypothetical protein